MFPLQAILKQNIPFLESLCGDDSYHVCIATTVLILIMPAYGRDLQLRLQTTISCKHRKVQVQKGKNKRKCFVLIQERKKKVIEYYISISSSNPLGKVPLQAMS